MKHHFKLISKEIQISFNTQCYFEITSFVEIGQQTKLGKLLNSGHLFKFF